MTNERDLTLDRRYRRNPKAAAKHLNAGAERELDVHVALTPSIDDRLALLAVEGGLCWRDPHLVRPARGYFQRPLEKDHGNGQG